MEEEDDDLYGTGPANGTGEAQQAAGQNGGNKVDEDLESGEEEEEDEEDSESDIEIVTERTDVPEVSIPSRLAKPDPSSSDATAAKPAEGETKRKASSAIQIVDPATKTRQPTNQPILFPGNQYPGIHSSTIDVKDVPLWNGKPITEIDIDADLAEQAKPWRRPGADQSDYFNYGFDEFTWSTYVMKQKTMADALSDQKAEAKQFENSLLSMGIPMPPGMPGGAMPGAGMPLAPTAPSANAPPTGPAAGMPTMPGMPAEADMYAAFMQVVASGQDPNQMDFGAFMQQSGMANQMGAQMGGQQGPGGQMGVPTGPSAGQQGQWGQNQGYGQQQGQQQGGRGRRGGRW